MDIYTRFLAAAALALSVTFSAQADVSFDGSYQEDFDSIPLKESVTLKGTTALGAQVAIPGLDGWVVARNGHDSEANLKFFRWTGDAAGRLYLFGDGGSQGQSLGALSTQSHSMVFGLSLVNRTGKTIDRLKVSFTSEVWKTGSRAQDVLKFTYGLSGGDITDSDFLTSPNMQSWVNLDVSGPRVSSDSQERDGKHDENRQKTESVIEGLGWAPGQTLYLAWSAQDSKGFGTALAMDDLTITAE